ncbi:MAG: DUF2335 domain-containing protein [Acidobacteriaceae bacterium]
MSEVECASLAQSGKTEENEAQVRSTIHAIGYAYSGPLPPPQVLREFEQILPGVAERIFIQFEAQAEHRRRSETKVIDSNTLSQKLGAISAPVIGLSGVVGGMILVGRGFNITGLGTVFAALGSIVATFLYQRHAQDRERFAKRSSNLRKP